MKIAPSWLFAKMKRLSAALIEIILLEFGPEELLRRIADPHYDFTADANQVNSEQQKRFS